MALRGPDEEDCPHGASLLARLALVPATDGQMAAAT